MAVFVPSDVKKRDYRAWAIELGTWRLYASLFWVAVLCSTFLFLALLLVGQTAFLNARTLWFSWTFLAAILITAVVQRQLLQVTFQSPVSFVGFCLTLKRPAILLYVATHATACVVCHFSLKFLTCQSASSLSIVPRCQQDLSVRCLNLESFHYLAFSVVLSLFYNLRFLYKRGYALRFPFIQLPRTTRVKLRMGHVCYNTLKTVVVFIPCYLIFVHVLAPTILQYGFSLFSLDVDTTHLIPSTAFLAKLIYFAILLVLCWEMVYHILEIIHSEPAKFFPSGTKNPNSRMLEGLADTTSSLMQHLAFLDLHIVAHSSELRRQYIFDDETGKIWNEVCTACCGVINQLTTELTEASKSTANGFIKKVWHFHGTSDPLRNYQIVVWATEAISRLVACSKDEDTIGVVQSCHGVPTVVGELVNCLKALEHQAELEQAGTEQIPRLQGNYLMRQDLQRLITVMEFGILTVILAFREHLATFTFPSGCAQKVRELTEF